MHSLGSNNNRNDALGDDSANQLVAFTESERLPGGLTKIKVRYSQENDICSGRDYSENGEGEGMMHLMQMVIPL